MGQADRQTDGQACKKKCTSGVSYIVIYVKLQPVVYIYVQYSNYERTATAAAVQKRHN